MDEKNLDKALEIISKLITGEVVGRNAKGTVSLYEDYSSNSEVYSLVQTILKKMNLSLYEYNYALYVTAGESNKIFGYTNEELKKEIGIKLNKELYLCYFTIYTIINKFYSDSSTFNYIEYVKLEDIINGIDSSLASVISSLSILALDEVEENSFKSLALIWEDLPMMTNEEAAMRAASGSKVGFVKRVFNFLVNQELMLETEGRYYPSERFKALIENYFEGYKGRLYEILKGEEENAKH